MPVFTCPSAREAARDDAVFNELIARLDEEDDDSDGWTNEYELQALWWKRVLSAFTKRHDRQEIPYVLELLRCVGDQRGVQAQDDQLRPETNRELLTEIGVRADPPYDDEQEIERSVHSAYTATA